MKYIENTRRILQLLHLPHQPVIVLLRNMFHRQCKNTGIVINVDFLDFSFQLQVFCFNRFGDEDDFFIFCDCARLWRPKKHWLHFWKNIDARAEFLQEQVLADLFCLCDAVASDVDEEHVGHMVAFFCGLTINPTMTTLIKNK